MANERNSAKLAEEAAQEEGATMSGRLRLLLGVAGVALYVLAAGIVAKSFETEKPPDFELVVVVLLALGTVLLLPWDYFGFTRLKVGNVEIERALGAQEQSITQQLVPLLDEVAALKSRVDVIAASQQDGATKPAAEAIKEAQERIEAESRKRRDLEDRLIDLLEEKGGRFMNISRIERYVREKNEADLMALDTSNLRGVLNRLIAANRVEVKISTRTGNRLYRPKLT